MSFVLGATVVVFCCILNISLIFGLHSGTKFTLEPAATFNVIEGNDVTFRWKFDFGGKDWNLFEQFYWGITDKNDIMLNKFITVIRGGIFVINPGLKDAIKERIAFSGTVSQNGCTLDFKLINVVKSDEDTYGCTASVDGYYRRSGPFQLNVLVPPTIKTTGLSTTIDAVVGDIVTLPCDATGDPVITISWAKDRKTVQSSTTITDLQLLNIQRNNAGYYTCTATNPHGSDTYSVQVNVA